MLWWCGDDHRLKRGEKEEKQIKENKREDDRVKEHGEINETGQKKNMSRNHFLVFAKFLSPKIRVFYRTITF